MTQPAAALGITAVLLAAAALGGCSSYAIEGVVIEGANAGVLTIADGDGRTQGFGVGGATVELTLDPASLSPKPLGVVQTDRRGAFSLPVGHGAGLLDYELGVMVRARGFRSIWQTLPLPGRGQQLLIVMTPGDDRIPAREPDVIEESIRLGDELTR